MYNTGSVCVDENLVRKVDVQYLMNNFHLWISIDRGVFYIFP